MPSTKNTTAQTPGYPLTCTVMAKPTKDNQTPGYPLTCSVMKKPAANGQTPGYPLTCTVIHQYLAEHFALRLQLGGRWR
ncbi:pheromone precursor 2 [Fusarium mundagurra]|uniref:Pheromone 2 n=1 Tax=Fusarium mundagurra TaxID=1567541 RepID=A0A8H5Z507_9HYPO|nr:pheromone precursor 2 [Fusarium mundagurra]